MTTNNHPAHGPVSLARLHQISEILSKAAAQSDGGNLGYAMADAVKVIGGAIAAFDAEPVAWRNKESGHCGTVLIQGKPPTECGYEPLYLAPPAPVVPEPKSYMDFWEQYPDMTAQEAIDRSAGWNACRAAMLQAGNHTEKHLDMVGRSGYANEKVDYKLPFDQWLSQQDGTIDVDCGCVTTEAFYHWLRVAYEAGNSPVLSPIDHGYRPDCECSGCIATARICEELVANPPVIPDTWIPVSERMPENKPGSYEYIVFESLNNRAHHDYWNVPDGSCDDFSPFWNYYGKYVTHWMPLPTAPQQEVEGE